MAKNPLTDELSKIANALYRSLPGATAQANAKAVLERELFGAEETCLKIGFQMGAGAVVVFTLDATKIMAETLAWLICDLQNRSDSTGLNPGSYSPELTTAMEVLEALKAGNIACYFFEPTDETVSADIKET